jgi:hypothetical protein
VYPPVTASRKGRYLLVAMIPIRERAKVVAMGFPHRLAGLFATVLVLMAFGVLVSSARASPVGAYWKESADHER